MNKSQMIGAVAALLITAAPLAYAQTSPAAHNPSAADHPTMTASANPTDVTIQPDQFRASKMIGSAVYDVENDKIGKVDDLIVDKDGQVAAVVVDMGNWLGIGSKSVAVKLSDIKTDNNRLTLDMTKQQLQQAQAYHETNPSTGAGTTASTVHGGQLGSGTGTEAPTH